MSIVVGYSYIRGPPAPTFFSEQVHRLEYIRLCMCVYSDIELLFLVGGFAESAMLQAEIRQQFGQRVKVAIPQEASLAILKGTLDCRRYSRASTERRPI